MKFELGEKVRLLPPFIHEDRLQVFVVVDHLSTIEGLAYGLETEDGASLGYYLEKYLEKAQ